MASYQDLGIGKSGFFEPYVAQASGAGPSRPNVNFERRVPSTALSAAVGGFYSGFLTL